MKFILTILPLFCLSCLQESITDSMLNNYLEINRGFQQSNISLEYSTGEILADLVLESKVKTQYISLVTAAKEVQKNSKKCSKYIDSLLSELEKGYIGMNSNRIPVYCQKNDCAKLNEILKKNNAPKKMFLSNKLAEGSLLEEKLIAVRKKNLTLISNLWGQGSIKGTIFYDPAIKEKMLQKLDREIPLSSPELFYKTKGKTTTNWSEKTFENLSLIELISLLSKYKNDIQVMEYMLIDFLNDQVGRLCDFGSTLNRQFLTLQADNTTITLGQPFEGKFILFFNSTPLSFRAFVNGKELEIKDNCALYQVTPQSIGIYKFTVDYLILNSNKSIESYSKEFSFQVIK